ncbi:nucleotidyltransferase domain-containing protein [Micromonospora sp. NPDC050795]|uniref:nucleotidyltransferase domain-containing protein n=1 Tax=Micromonospora sp. NPDC050795 TaxID=3364282 RepID=UPI00379BA05C
MNTLLETVAAANLPHQFELLETSVEALSHSPAVQSLHIRGSLATGTADRLSDVDLIVAVHDPSFASFVQVIDALMTAELGAVLPGWRDTIVARMGGLGYVYLVAYGGKLYQVDLYIVPVSRLDTVLARTAAMPVYLADGATSRPHSHVDWVINSTLERPYTSGELLVEILVLGHMIRKRISRGQRFIAYAEMFALHTAVKNLIKAALAPESLFYGWYQLSEEIGSTPIGRQCLADLERLISGNAVPSGQDLAAALSTALAVAERAAPAILEPLRPAVDAYWHYLEFA